MSIESFHRSLHGATNSEPLLVKLRAITKVQDPAAILAASIITEEGNWIQWDSSSSGSGDF